MEIKMKELNCVICKNPKIKNKYTKTCGDLGCRKKLTQQTNLERYGNICNLHSKQGKKQVRKTFLKNYGVGSIAELSKLEDIKKKKIETCRKNFGVDHPQQSKVVRDKSIETLLKKYGVDNISKLPEIIAKIKDIKFTKDPITNVSIYEISRIKNIETCRKKYGVDFYFQTGREQEAITMLEALVKSTPENGRARLALADIYRQKGRKLDEFQQLKAAFACEDVDLDTKMKILIGSLHMAI
jgi:tetratricopeptide (TPR) repeat protein